MEPGSMNGRLTRITAAVSRNVGEGKFPGAVTLAARAGKIFHYEAQGVQDLENASPMRLDSIFRIHSMAKPFTTAAILQLYETGSFHLNQPLSRFLPQARELKVLDEHTGHLVPLDRDVTLFDLLTHTAGFSYAFHDSSPVDKLYRDMPGYATKPLAEFVDNVLELPLVSQPGTRWRYSVATDILARVVEISSGMRFEDFLQRNIFDPLGMPDTGFTVPASKHHRLVTMYGAMNIEDPSVTTIAQKEATLLGPIIPLYVPAGQYLYSDRPTIRGGHAMLSTALDYFKFCQMLLNGGEYEGVRLLGRKTVELISRNMLPEALLPYDDPPKHGCGFGLGFNVILDSRKWGFLISEGSYSWGGAASTSFWIDPKERIVGVQMAQFQPYGFFPFVDDFRVAVYSALE